MFVVVVALSCCLRRSADTARAAEVISCGFTPHPGGHGEDKVCRVRDAFERSLGRGNPRRQTEWIEEELCGVLQYRLHYCTEVLAFLIAPPLAPAEPLGAVTVRLPTATVIENPMEWIPRVPAHLPNNWFRQEGQ